jgi:DNA processing protein
LAESAGVPVEQVRAALTLLELDGLVVLVDGGWRRA